MDNLKIQRSDGFAFHFFHFQPRTSPIVFLFWNFRYRLVRYYLVLYINAGFSSKSCLISERYGFEVSPINHAFGQIWSRLHAAKSLDDIPSLMGIRCHWIGVSVRKMFGQVILNCCNSFRIQSCWFPIHPCHFHWELEWPESSCDPQPYVPSWKNILYPVGGFTDSLLFKQRK